MPKKPPTGDAGPQRPPVDDPVARALGGALPAVRRLRWALLAVLITVVILRLLGVIDPSWQVLLWLVAAVAVIPPLLVAWTAARHLENPKVSSDDGQRGAPTA